MLWGGEGWELNAVDYILSTLGGTVTQSTAAGNSILGLKISLYSLPLFSGALVQHLLVETLKSKDAFCHYSYILYISLTAYGSFVFLGHHLLHKYLFTLSYQGKA